MARVAVIGAGNLGVFLASTLSSASHEVFFCVRRPPPPIRMEGCPALTLPFFVKDPPPADIVLLAVKVFDTPSAREWLPALTRNGRYPTAVVQNGVHHGTRVAPFPAIPVLSLVYIEGQGGVYRVFAPPQSHFSVPLGPSSEPFTKLFTPTTIRIREEADFHTAAWRKMLQNCVSNPLTALAGRGLEILAEPAYRRWAEAILAEALPIAQADGAKLSIVETQKILEFLASYPPGTRTSMLQDHEKGKRVEIEALNGTVVELGRRYNLGVSVNEDLVNRLQVGFV